MRILMILTLVVLTAPAFAGDDFGARFGTQSSAGFEDTNQDPAKALSEIMPAAGDETDPTEPGDQSPETAAQDEGNEDTEGLSATKELR